MRDAELSIATGCALAALCGCAVPPAAERVLALRNSQPVSRAATTVLVRYGSEIVARFGGVRWSG